MRIPARDRRLSTRPQQVKKFTPLVNSYSFSSSTRIYKRLDMVLCAFWSLS